MADKNQLKAAPPIDFSEDDPFAELTRIMGFDPRQPVKQPEPAPAPAQLEHAADDDFSLDLEKELLGGFDFQDEQEQQFADEPVAEIAAPEPEVAPADLDFDFAGAFDDAMAEPQAYEPPALEPQAFEPPPVEPLAFESQSIDQPEAIDVESEFVADFEAAFAEPVAAEPVAAADDFELDLALTDDEVRALDAATPVRLPLPITPETVADTREFDDGFDAAMAGIDMDFGGAPAENNAPEPAPAVALAFDDAPASAEEPLEADLFDDVDFGLEAIEPAMEAPVEVAASSETFAEPEPQPEFDDGVFNLGDEAFRLDEVAAPAEEIRVEPQAFEPEPEDPFAFDAIDFGADDMPLAEETAAEMPVEEPPVIAEASLAARPEPISADSFQLSVPAYVPRKLPVSPMDVAAEEYRHREEAAAPAAPEFNLEDELNALLGNVRQIAARADAAAPVLAPAVPAPVEAAYTPPAPVFSEPRSFAPEPVGFDAPEHPADIGDDLSWELDDAFAAQSSEQEPEEAEYRDDARYADEASYADDAAYAEEQAAQEEAEPIDLDEAFADLDRELMQPQPASYGGAALAGAAVGAAAGYAASRQNYDFGSRPYEMAPRQLAAEMPRQLAAPQSASTHRDPVVRGNPLKEDPLDIITQLAEKYSKKEPITPYGRAIGAVAGTVPAYDEPQSYEPQAYDARSYDTRAYDEAEVGDDLAGELAEAFEPHPEVETVEVADQAMALADDLDIPELPEVEDLPSASPYDDLDAEFSSLLTDMNNEQPAEQERYDDPLAGGFTTKPYEAAQPKRQLPAANYDERLDVDAFALDADDLPGSRAVGSTYADDRYDYDPDVEQDIAPAYMAAGERAPARSRGLLIAGIVGGVALVGAIGAFALSYGDGSGSDAPALVQADDGPVKIKPENPGGATVPNQENKVYETVAREAVPSQPQQDKLVTTAEEPMDVAPPPAAAAPETASGKSEDRIEQILQDAENQPDSEIVAVTPRKVRTMVVKPDGTLVPREDEPAATSGETTDTIAAVAPEAQAARQVAAAAPAPANPAPALAPAPEATAVAPEPEPVTDGEETAATPETAPIAPLRPVDQPVDVVGEVKPDQVAVATTATAAGGNWAMQIASQPSEAAAQSSYQDLARRYGSVLQGREVNIVKAEISGKGTFWRVRVPAANRNEAIGLCEQYKSAGGNCFVSR